jgi:hypothetical protein
LCKKYHTLFLRKANAARLPRDLYTDMEVDAEILDVNEEEARKRLPSVDLLHIRPFLPLVLGNRRTLAGLFSLHHHCDRIRIGFACEGSPRVWSACTAFKSMLRVAPRVTAQQKMDTGCGRESERYHIVRVV